MDMGYCRFFVFVAHWFYQSEFELFACKRMLIDLVEIPHGQKETPTIPDHGASP